MASDKDPIDEYAALLRHKFGGSPATEIFNVNLLRTLFEKKQINKRHVFWNGERIAHIKNFSTDAQGRLRVDVSSHRPDKRYVANSAALDMHAIKQAILHAKQLPL